MRIARVEVYGYELTYRGEEYVMSGGRSIASLDSTVVRVITDDGVDGYGETCPLGGTYLAAHAEGARAALRELAPAVIGADVAGFGVLHDRMDAVLTGHAYAKSAIDVACWDAAAKTLGISVSTLLGGRRLESFPLYVAVPLGPPQAMADHAAQLRADGITRFQLKVGDSPRVDAERVAAVLAVCGPDDVVIADANGRYTTQAGVVAARLLAGYDGVYIEQPCPTVEACSYVRGHTDLPFVLDECIHDPASLVHAHDLRALEAFNLKISKVGGLTKARQMRDLAESLGLSVTIEDTWGGDLVTAAVAHLAATTREQHLFTVSFMNDWTNEHVAGYAPRSSGGRGSAPTAPGLGIEVDLAALGAPLQTSAQT
ncbi:MAG TPA: mandelate racemase/muconate lactonizing enzyme family protein [Gaiellales bacterium]